MASGAAPTKSSTQSGVMRGKKCRPFYPSKVYHQCNRRPLVCTWVAHHLCLVLNKWGGLVHLHDVELLNQVSKNRYSANNFPPLHAPGVWHMALWILFKCLSISISHSLGLGKQNTICREMSTFCKPAYPFVLIISNSRVHIVSSSGRCCNVHAAAVKANIAQTWEWWVEMWSLWHILANTILTTCPYLITCNQATNLNVECTHLLQSCGVVAGWGGIEYARCTWLCTKKWTFLLLHWYDSRAINGHYHRL